jgi:diguanylate cyclase (GGDEF)-like protein
MRRSVADPALPDFRTFLRVASLLNSSLELTTVLHDLLAGLEQLLRPSHWSLLLVDEVTRELVFTVVRGEAEASLRARRLPAGEGVAGWVVVHDEALLIADVATDPRFSARMDTLSGFRTKSIVAVPLRARDRCIGVLELVNALDDRAFTEADIGVLRAYADFAALAIDNARTHAAAVELTRTDHLSGLRNSQYFLTCVGEAIGRTAPFALVFFDMDRFKDLVDTYGHVRGSAALAEVGAVLRGVLRPAEIGCRFGGDEFTLLLPDCDRAAAEARCRELAAVLAGHTFLADAGIATKLSASFGAAAFPDDGDTATSLLHQADARMYAQKRARKVARTS